MNLATLTADVRAQAAQLASFGHTIKFDLEGVGLNIGRAPYQIDNDVMMERAGQASAIVIGCYGVLEDMM